MRANHLILAIMLLALAVTPAMAGNDPGSTGAAPYSDSYGPGMMGPGYGGMMGHGYGMMHGYGRGWGMMGPGYHGWQGMSQADRERWASMRSQFIKETLPIRQKMGSIYMELETEWNQANPDMKKVRKLSDQLSDLRSELDKKRNEFLSQCRESFGDRGWSCPGAGYGYRHDWR